MCLAIPMRLIERRELDGTVELRGVTRGVSLMLFPEAELGDHLLVHAGYAIGRIDEEEARLTLELLDQVTAHDEATGGGAWSDSPYDVLTDGWVIGAIVLLLVVEVFADKVPMIDHVNDLVGTVVRPAAGAVLFAATMTGAVSDIDPRVALVAGALAAGVAHGAKATARPVVTATTGGIGNPVVSTIEDVAALITSLVAILAPVLLAVALVLFVILVIYVGGRRRTTGARA